MNAIEIEETIVSKEIRNIKSVFNDDTLTEKELLEIELSKKETRAGLWLSHSEVQKEARER
jgi:hypothetical protein